MIAKGFLWGLAQGLKNSKDSRILQDYVCDFYSLVSLHTRKDLETCFCLESLVVIASEGLNILLDKFVKNSLFEGSFATSDGANPLLSSTSCKQTSDVVVFICCFLEENFDISWLLLFRDTIDWEFVVNRDELLVVFCLGFDSQKLTIFFWGCGVLDFDGFIGLVSFWEAPNYQVSMAYFEFNLDKSTSRYEVIS